MPTFEGPKVERIRAYMFDSGEGVWLCPRNSEEGAFICPRLWGEMDQFTYISDREFDHAKRILKLEVPGLQDLAIDRGQKCLRLEGKSLTR